MRDPNFEEINGHVERMRNHISSGQVHELFFKDDWDGWNTLCVGMDTLEDTLMALSDFLRSGVGRSDAERYLRLYGVQQAVFIQQDTLRALYELVTSTKFPRPPEDSAWETARNLRNHVTGHPVARRTFLTRISLEFGKLGLITTASPEKGESTHWGGDLNEMLSGYFAEAVGLVRQIEETMKKRWPVPP